MQQLSNAKQIYENQISSCKLFELIPMRWNISFNSHEGQFSIIVRKRPHANIRSRYAKTIKSRGPLSLTSRTSQVISIRLIQCLRPIPNHHTLTSHSKFPSFFLNDFLVFWASVSESLTEIAFNFCGNIPLKQCVHALAYVAIVTFCLPASGSISFPCL